MILLNESENDFIIVNNDKIITNLRTDSNGLIMPVQFKTSIVNANKVKAALAIKNCKAKLILDIKNPDKLDLPHLAIDMDNNVYMVTPIKTEWDIDANTDISEIISEAKSNRQKMFNNDIKTTMLFQVWPLGDDVITETDIDYLIRIDITNDETIILYDKNQNKNSTLKRKFINKKPDVIPVANIEIETEQAGNIIAASNNQSRTLNIIMQSMNVGFVGSVKYSPDNIISSLDKVKELQKIWPEFKFEIRIVGDTIVYYVNDINKLFLDDSIDDELSAELFAEMVHNCGVINIKSHYVDNPTIILDIPYVGCSE